jgi:hypothetical protein
MFDWGDPKGRVSKKFWIYWVVSVPLTVAVMVGWKRWYRYVVEEFRRDAFQEKIV